MKLAFMVFVSFGLACSSFVPPVIDIGVCSAGKLGPQIAGVRAQVKTCLGGETFAACLASLESDLTVANGKDVAVAIVVCAVREFTGAGAGPAVDPAVRERAKAYLNMKGIRT
jgi:hypothetical protein